MPSPFPGMDPFVEVNPRWECIHAWFIRKLAEQTLPKARELDCWINVERTIYQLSPTGEVMMIGAPDEAVRVELTETGSRHARSGNGVALAEPRAVHDIVLDPEKLERIKQDRIVVRELGRFNRVLAVMELLSPANKAGTYVPRYRQKRQQFLESSVHFMEVDLLRDGDNPARELFPELPPSPYFIFVARKTPLGRKEEGYPIELNEPLPRIGLPLGPPRPDLALDLQAAFEAAYDLTISPRSIDYRGEAVPPPPLSDSDAAFVRETVHRA